MKRSEAIEKLNKALIIMVINQESKIMNPDHLSDSLLHFIEKEIGMLPPDKAPNDHKISIPDAENKVLSYFEWEPEE